MYPGSSVYANVSGTITKFGYPYGDDRSFKYVQITTEHNQEHRYFYVEPQKGLKVGDEIFEGQKIGTSQELGKRYEGITEHIHYEVRYKGGAYVDPNSYLLE